MSTPTANQSRALVGSPSTVFDKETSAMPDDIILIDVSKETDPKVSKKLR